MKDLVILALVMATLGQAALCVTMLLVRSVRTQAYLPLAIFFLAGGFVAAGPAVAAFLPELETRFIALTLPAYLLLGPTLWLYVEALTAETAWRLRARHGRHFVLAALGLAVAGLVSALPAESRTAMLVEGREVDSPLAAVLMICAFLLILGWLAQSGFYGIRVFLRLSRYRRRLKDLFASNEQSELRWIGWLLAVLVGLWLLAAANTIAENFFGVVLVGQRAGSTMALLLVWTLALWGLRQKPGLEGRYLDDVADAADRPPAGPEQKYRRSALGEHQAARIAARIEAAMSRDRIYLDPALSLHKLARHVAISPNHVSQTLNETIGANFFDYVNSWRVTAAKPLVLAGEESILAIALGVGFNTRSSFYKTFRRVTGQTPGEYRRVHRLEADERRAGV